jgi:hypothetical protein
MGQTGGLLSWTTGLHFGGKMIHCIGEMEAMMIELLASINPGKLSEINCLPVRDRHCHYARIVDRFLTKRDEKERHRRISDMVGQKVWVHLPDARGMVDFEGRLIGLNIVENSNDVEATILCRGEKVTFDPHTFQPHLVNPEESHV